MIDLTKLLSKDSLFQDEEYLPQSKIERKFNNEVYWKFVELFGIERYKFWKRTSDLLTREQIAQTLLNRSLVSNLQAALKETDTILDKGLNLAGMRLYAIKYLNKKDEAKYKLNSYTPTHYDF